MILVSKAAVSTEKASRYLQQMCKHFAHKLDVEFDREAGKVSFPFGELNLTAKNDQLQLTVQTEQDETMLARMEKATADHLVRFMFREEPEIKWVRGD